MDWTIGIFDDGVLVNVVVIVLPNVDEVCDINCADVNKVVIRPAQLAELSQRIRSRIIVL